MRGARDQRDHRPGGALRGLDLARRKPEQAALLSSFTAAPTETAYTVLTIVTAIMARRLPSKAVPRRRPRAPLLAEADKTPEIKP